MRNILKAIVFTGIMGVATATWGTRQEIKIGDNVTLNVPENIPELFTINDNELALVGYNESLLPNTFGLDITAGDTDSTTVQLVQVISNFQNGNYHGLKFQGTNTLCNNGKKEATCTGSFCGSFALCLCDNDMICLSGPLDLLMNNGMLPPGIVAGGVYDFSAVYRIKITAKSGETEVSKCFDFLVGGKCDLSTQKAPLEVIPEETIPDILTKNTEGQIVFAPPRPIGTVRLPKGRTCSSITLASPNVYKAGTETKEPSDISTLQIKGRLKDTGDWGTEIKKADGTAITEADIIELVVDPGTTGTLSTPGEFDWSSVIRMSLTPVA